MISSEVQRTLVKSPPELWAELSDPNALARHLGELGVIRIIHTEPDKTVEWAAENITGTVSIQPSGWGTNVKLTVTREMDEPKLTPEPQPAVEPDPEPALAAEPEPTPVAEPESGPEPRRSFLARLFGRRRRTEPLALSTQTAAAEPRELSEPPALSEPLAGDREAPNEPASDLSAELMAAEEVAAEEVTAVLTAVLDRLGAAHHRPFSRA